MINIIAICGEASSGKSSTLDSLIKNYPTKYHKKVSHTTREKRKGEIDGVDYHFVSPNEFFELLLNDDIKEAVDFNGEIYGTAKSNLLDRGVNVGIFELEGIEILDEDININILPIYLKVNERERFIRAIKRDKNISIDDIYERYKIDNLAFSKVKNVEGMVTIDSNFKSPDEIAKEIHTLSEKFFKNLTNE